MATRLFEPGADDVLYVVDISGYVFRAYHAIQPLTSPTGEPTHAVFGTVNMLERLVKQCQPRMLAVAMDSRTRTFRKELYPEYKANRPPPPPDLKQQMKRVGEIVSAFSIAVFQQDGVEADDLIASAVARARKRNLRVVIVSADKDLMQLVGDDVVLWDTMRDRVFGPDEVKERFGVEISQLRDLLALTGDSSDNVPGVPSVGPKTARDLLQQFGTLEEIFSHLGEIKRKKLRETLEANRDNAELSQRLVSLKDDCDLNFSPQNLSYHGRNLKELRQLYADLGFQRHLVTLEREQESQLNLLSTEAETPATGAQATDDTPISVTTVNDAEGLRGLAKEIEKSGRCAVELTYTAPEAMTATLVGIALSVSATHAVYIPIAHRLITGDANAPLAEVIDNLGTAFRSGNVGKAGHDLKHTLVIAANHGIELEKLSFDCLLAGYLLNPEVPHDLVSLAQAHLNLRLDGYEELTRKGRSRRTFDEIEVDEAANYAGRRANAVFRLWTLLDEQLEELGLKKIHDDLELPLTQLLAELERRGVLIDSTALSELGDSVGKQLEVLEKKAHEIAGHEFNVNSPRQLEKLLFDELGLKHLKRTKTSRSTDAATLESLAEEHELPKVILEIRQLAKLKGTYIDALPLLVNQKTGRIHTRWGQAVAATGRLSSSDPNLQNIPIRSDLGRAIRGAFIAPPGHLLLSADYSQIELRVLAHLSEDPVLIDAFRTGQDIHTRTAMEIFEVAEADVSAELRRRAKAVNFGVIYGQGDSGLAKSLGISRAEAGNFIAAYFRRYEGVRHFMDSTLEKARAGDSVRTLLGRRRVVPDIKSANRARRLAAERIAMNMPIQGTAADILKLAMLRLREPVTKGTCMILTVHDELVFEVPEDEIEAAAAKVKDAMENVQPLQVPLEVDVGHGKTWTQAH